MTVRLKGFVRMLAVAIASGALFWLLREHWRHTLGFLPYALFLTCPLMHLFMHHGHHPKEASDGHLLHDEAHKPTT